MRKKTIGEVLKLARTNQGLSLEELSKMASYKELILFKLMEILASNLLLISTERLLLHIFV